MRFLFWKPEGHVKWQLIPATKTALESAISKGAKYITIAQFTIDDNGNPTRYFAPLYFDFDGEDITDAINDVRSLINTLGDEFDYPIDAAKIFLSGGRGVHLELPSSTFGAEDGDANLPHIYKKMAESFGLKTTDLSVYSLGKGRQWRLPNCQRPNGRYKVPLTTKELLQTDLDELLKLTNNPRSDFDYPNPNEFSICHTLEDLYIKNRNEFYWQRELSPSKPVPEEVLQKKFANSVPACISSILNTKGLSATSDKNFNHVATIAATYYTRAGLKESALLEEIELFCKHNFHDSKHYPTFELKQKHLSNQYHYVQKNPEYTFSCGLMKSIRKNYAISFSCDKCPINETERSRQKTNNDAYTLIDANKLLSMQVDRHEPIIDELVPSKAIVILSGDTGVGKSLLVHALCISAALGLDEFLGFHIFKPHNVLYINLELNIEYLQDRHKKLTDYILNNYLNNSSILDRLYNLKINLIDANTKLFESQWDRITTTLKTANPPFDLIAIDNLYASTDEDEEKNYRLKPLLGKINQLRHDYGCTFILVTHHSKRHFDDKILQLRMIRGGSTLVNFADVVLQMAKSNMVEGLRIFKPSKERGGGKFEDIPIGFFLDPDTLWFKNVGVIDNEIIHLSPSGKSDILKALEAMDDKFESKAFEEYVTKELKKSIRTAKYWLKKLILRKQINHKGWGRYEKVEPKMEV